jgi:hypothetical protein
MVICIENCGFLQGILLSKCAFQIFATQEEKQRFSVLDVSLITLGKHKYHKRTLFLY